MNNIPELLKKSTRIFLDRLEKLFHSYTEFISKILSFEDLQERIQQEKPKLVIPEAYKEFQEQRAVRICSQLDYRHPRIIEPLKRKITKIENNPSAKKEENPIKGLTREGLEQKLQELALSTAKKRHRHSRSDVPRPQTSQEEKPLTKPQTPAVTVHTKSESKKKRNFGSEIMISKFVTEFVSRTKALVEDKELFEADRQNIRVAHEENLRRYYDEQLMMVNPPKPKKVNPEISRLYQVDANDYKKQFIKQSQFLSQINFRN